TRVALCAIAESAIIQRVTRSIWPGGYQEGFVIAGLPIAIAILMHNGIIPSAALTKIALIGELSLDGNVRPVDGVLPIAIAAKRDEIDTLIVPYEKRRRSCHY
ncbi:MAG: hypothetical protein LRZ88_07230, partial [Candidatus Cloacimonetes bacterium]|nr:hypothetical protein [Candidatus Cloacimonadota bacterium]